jgi:hypothetical protein
MSNDYLIKAIETYVKQKIPSEFLNEFMQKVQKIASTKNTVQIQRAYEQIDHICTSELLSNGFKEINQLNAKEYPDEETKELEKNTKLDGLANALVDGFVTHFKQNLEFKNGYVVGINQQRNPDRACTCDASLRHIKKNCSKGGKTRRRKSRKRKYTK